MTNDPLSRRAVLPLLRGEGLFETIACEEGEPLLLPYHFERLDASAAALGIPFRTRPRALRDLVVRALRERRTRSAAAKVVLLPAAGRRDALSVHLRPLARPPARDYPRGVALAVAPWRRAPGNPLHRHKTLCYWENRLAREQARAHGAFDALFLSPDGAVLEGAATNVFCVRRGLIRTPPLAAGILPGVMRRFALEACREALGVPVREARLTLRDLAAADEVFVTNALIAALPVSSLAGRRLPARPRPGAACPTAQRINAVYRRATGASVPGVNPKSESRNPKE